MRHRPWPIIILAAAQLFIEPITNTLLDSWLSQMSASEFILDFIHRRDWMPLAFTIALPMLMGYSVWAMKRWSYPAYLVGALWGLFGNFRTWRLDPHAFPIWLFLPLFILNLAVVSYFLLPTVRIGFFNPKLRWWESHPRYQVDLPAMIRFGEKVFSSRITNLSVGGIFANIPEISDELPTGSDVEIFFRFLNRKLHLTARLVHSRGKAGSGLQFRGLSHEKIQLLRKIVFTLDQFGYPGRHPRYLTLGNFWIWLKRAVTEHQGLVPEISSQSLSSGPAPTVSATTESESSQDAQSDSGIKIA